MKKSIMTILTVLIMTTSFQANSMVGAFTAVFNPAAGVNIALAGLGIAGVGTAMMAASDEELPANGLFTLIVGLVVLDGQDNESLTFKELPSKDLAKIGLSSDEQVAYNENVEELTFVFNMIADTTESKQEAKIEWQEQEAQLGSDAINGLKKVLNSSLK